jgi:ATP-dependent exoDNAse (exonuclease V) alpha subunit
MNQEKAIELALHGYNIFLTGRAGTGKSYTVNKIIEALKSKGKEIAITASTGIAAVHIGGNTIHSWAGIGIKDKLELEDLWKIKNNKFSFEKINSAQIIIIDEISMLHDYRFDMVDEVLRFVKGSDKPFGGIQVIVVGDFFQLPPVEKSGKNNYTFNATAWDQLDFKVCYLEKIYRQENDIEFMNILNAIRENSITAEQKAVLTFLNKNDKYKDKAINLYSKNIDVEKENNYKLDCIEGEKYTFAAEINGEPFHVQRILKNWLGREFLHLKIGAKVMFIVNDHKQGFYNGTMGEIIDFDRESGYPVVKIFKTKEKITVKKNEWKVEEENEITGNKVKLASVLQFPLRLAYAITIHKSQGCTFDYVNLDMSDVFVLNMGYVALSRITSLDGLWLKGYNFISLHTDVQVINKDKEFLQKSRDIE